MSQTRTNTATKKMWLNLACVGCSLFHTHCRLFFYWFFGFFLQKSRHSGEAKASIWLTWKVTCSFEQVTRKASQLFVFSASIYLVLIGTCIHTFYFTYKEEMKRMKKKWSNIHQGSYNVSSVSAGAHDFCHSHIALSTPSFLFLAYHHHQDCRLVPVAGSFGALCRVK